MDGLIPIMCPLDHSLYCTQHGCGGEHLELSIPHVLKYLRSDSVSSAIDTGY